MGMHDEIYLILKTAAKTYYNRITVNKSTPTFTIKRRIAKIHGNLIDATHIELLKRDGNWYSEREPTRLEWNDPITQRECTVDCHFVLYDTKLFDSLLVTSQNQLYKVQIYKPSQCPQPRKGT